PDGEGGRAVGVPGGAVDRGPGDAIGAGRLGAAQCDRPSRQRSRGRGRVRAAGDGGAAGDVRAAVAEVARGGLGREALRLAVGRTVSCLASRYGQDLPVRSTAAWSEPSACPKGRSVEPAAFIQGWSDRRWISISMTPSPP